MNIFENEQALQIIAGIVAMLWATFRGTEWYAAIHEGRAATMLGHIEEAVEAAVVSTYHDYVEAIKRGPHDTGKLTREQAHNARASARALAIHNGHALGLDLMKIVGEDGLALAIEVAVKRQKGIA